MRFEEMDRRELDRRNAEFPEKNDILLVVGRREKIEVKLRAKRGEFAVRLRRELELAEHLDLRFAAIRVAQLVGGLGSVGARNAFGLESLEFHGVRPAFLRGMHEPARKFRRAIMVHAGLGDDVAAFLPGKFQRR